MTEFKQIIDYLQRADEAGQGAKERELISAALNKTASLLMTRTIESGYSSGDAARFCEMIIDQARPDVAYRCEECYQLEHGHSEPEQCATCGNEHEFTKVYQCQG